MGGARSTTGADHLRRPGETVGAGVAPLLYVRPMETRHALVRPPSSRMGEGLVTHIERSDDVDYELAVRQWQAYVDALHGAGWTTTEVEAADELPDSVF